MKTIKYMFCVAALAVCGSVSAASFTFVFNGTTSGTGTPVSVDAQAVFVTSTDMLSITLTNLLVNQLTVGQNISDISFTLSNVTSTGSISSSNGTPRTVNHGTGGAFTDGAAGSVAPPWVLQNVSSGNFELTALSGNPGATETIIGSPDGTNHYSAANASIVGNSKKDSEHNPFLAGDVTFDLSISGINSGTQISNVIFSFGTGVGEGSGSGTCTSGCGEQAPDGGTTSLLLGFALTGLGVIRRYFKG